MGGGWQPPLPAKPFSKVLTERRKAPSDGYNSDPILLIATSPLSDETRVEPVLEAGGVLFKPLPLLS